MNQHPIKFRAYDKENKVLLKWHQLMSPQYNICLAGQMEEYLQTQKRWEPLLFNVLLNDIKYEINLWSGFNDQMDKNIFSNDIVINPQDNQIYIVRFGEWDGISPNPYYGFYLEEIKSGTEHNMKFNLVLLGNVYENPELIK